MRLLNADEIEVKVKQVKGNGLVALLYKTARVDMDLLDETYGEGNWQDAYEEIKGNLYCKIGVWNEKLSQWIWKQDCGIESREDGEGNEKKGEASDAFKRAGFRWGIGRELYTAPFIWISSDLANIKQFGQKYTCNDKFYVSQIEYNEKREIIALEIKNGKNVVVYTFGKIKRAQTPQEQQSGTTNFMSVEDFSKQVEKINDITELRLLVNSQKGHPEIKKLIDIATIRKEEILTFMQK